MRLTLRGTGDNIGCGSALESADQGIGTITGGGLRMRVIESKGGATAVWLPSIRSRRYALITVMSLAPALLLSAELLLKRPDAVSAILVVGLVVLAAVPLLRIARGNGFFITADFVLIGSPRRPSRRVPRAEVVQVRYRGEYGELLRSDGQVLLQIPRLLTRQQASEVADYLHVPFSGRSSSAPVADVQDVAGVYVLRPDRRKVFRYGLIAGLFVVGGVGVGVWELIDRHWSTAILLVGGYVVLAVVGVAWIRVNALVITEDSVYKGTRNRGKYVARSEIAEVRYGPGLSLKAANGSRLLSLDGSIFTSAQAEELAVRLDVPLNHGAKVSRPH
jgi:hypothetical protein